MIEWVHFTNFKALRDTRLPLGRFTLIVGPNGSGKSTALQGLAALRQPGGFGYEELRTAGLPPKESVSIEAKWESTNNHLLIGLAWVRDRRGAAYQFHSVDNKPQGNTQNVREKLFQIRIFALDAYAIAQSVILQPNMELSPNGAQLAGVVERMRDQHPERFKRLNEELSRWLPEFDYILFDVPGQGQKKFGLRTREGGHTITASALSQGTLVALALLTLAYLPDPPSVIGLEEPDHGLHPRLLRDVRDAIYRLAYPENCGEKREPVQVVATTHNPYFLDLFREHPEEIVIAEKTGMEAKFSRLSDRSDLNEILGESHLGEVWYSGVLGGVPAGT